MTIQMNVINGSEDPNGYVFTGTLKFNSPRTGERINMLILCDCDGVHEIENLIDDFIFIGFHDDIVCELEELDLQNSKEEVDPDRTYS